MDNITDEIQCEEVYGEDEAGTYLYSEGFTKEDGSIEVRQCTNDNEDKGYPTEYAEWSTMCKNREEFDRRIGKSGRGCIGSVVTVILDGKVIK